MESCNCAVHYTGGAVQNSHCRLCRGECMLQKWYMILAGLRELSAKHGCVMPCDAYKSHLSSPLHHSNSGMKCNKQFQILRLCQIIKVASLRPGVIVCFLDICCGDMQSSSVRTCSSISWLSSTSTHTAYTACSAWGRVCDAAPASPSHPQLQQCPQELRSDCTD